MRKDCRLLGLVLLLFLGLSCHSAHAAETGGIAVGATLPVFKMEAPAARADQEYLGLNGSEPFTLSEVSGKLIIMDFFAVV